MSDAAIPSGDPLAIAFALLLMGLGGSATHCVGMCGPFVVAQAGAVAGARAVEGNRVLARLRGASLLPYQLGRATTYAALGAASAGLVDFVANLAGFRILAALFLCAAAIALLARAIGRSLPLVDRFAARLVPAGPPAFARDLMADPRGWRGYALGMALGFLPCVFLYAALAAASAAGGAAAGAAAMAAFALGTAPGLLAAGWAGALFARRHARLFAVLSTLAMLASAALLLSMALRLVT
ncbi:MAG: sulfite exporter TauE/SafE family protein [Alphaproteobacteria bacterium]